MTVDSSAYLLNPFFVRDRTLQEALESIPRSESYDYRDSVFHLPLVDVLCEINAEKHVDYAPVFCKDPWHARQWNLVWRKHSQTNIYAIAMEINVVGPETVDRCGDLPHADWIQRVRHGSPDLNHRTTMVAPTIEEMRAIDPSVQPAVVDQVEIAKSPLINQPAAAESEGIDLAAQPVVEDPSKTDSQTLSEDSSDDESAEPAVEQPRRYNKRERDAIRQDLRQATEAKRPKRAIPALFDKPKRVVVPKPPADYVVTGSEEDYELYSYEAFVPPPLREAGPAAMHSWRSSRSRHMKECGFPRPLKKIVYKTAKQARAELSS